MSAETTSQFSDDSKAPLEISAKDIADQLLNQGFQQLENYDFEAALKSCQAALAIYRDISDRLGEACALNNIGNLSHHQAVQFYSEEIFQEFEIKAKETTQSNLEKTVNSEPNWFIPGLQGNILIYGKVPDGNQPIKPPPTDPPSVKYVAARLLEQSRKHYEKKEFQAALQSCQEALTIYQEVGEHLWEACTLNNLGSIYHSQAEAFYSQAMKILSKDALAGAETSKRNLEESIQSPPDWFIPSTGTILISRGNSVDKKPIKPPPTDNPSNTPSNTNNDPSNIA